VRLFSWGENGRAQRGLAVAAPDDIVDIVDVVDVVEDVNAVDEIGFISLDASNANRS
jgi:hypothetical protein